MKKMTYFIVALVFLLMAGMALASGNKATTTVDKVWVDGGVTYVQTAEGLFKMSPEVSAKEDAQATKYLMSVAGTEEKVSFTFNEEMQGGEAIFVISDKSVREFSSKRIYVGNLPFSASD